MKGIKGLKGLLILDLIIVVAVLAMIGITSIIGIMIQDDFIAGMSTVENFNSSGALNHTLNARQAVAETNEGSIIIFIGLVAAAIISAYSLRQHPVYAIFTIITLFIAAYIVAGISNFYQDFANDPQVVAVASEFPLIQQLMENIVAIIFIVGMLIIIVMFAKYREGTGVGENL